MRFLKTFNKTALAVSILIGFTTTSCNSSHPETSDINAIKMEGIKEGRTFTYGGGGRLVTLKDKFKQFIWNYALVSKTITDELNAFGYTPLAGDTIFFCNYISEELEIDASESEEAMKSYFLASNPMHQKFIRWGAWNRSVEKGRSGASFNNLGTAAIRPLGHSIEEMEAEIKRSDERYLEKQKKFDVMDTFVPEDFNFPNTFSFKEHLDQKRSSELYVITDIMDWANPNYIMDVSWLVLDDAEYRKERDMFYENFKLDKDCLSPEEVDRINFDAFIEYK